MTDRPPVREATPVSNRLLVLQLVRLLGALTALVVATVVRDVDPAFALGVLVYALLVGVSELFRRRRPEHTDVFVSSTVLLDGVALASAVAVTGGYRSPLLFLVFLDVVAITLLVSYRTGLTFALWCALLILLAHAAADAGIIGVEPAVSDVVAAVSAASFVLFAAGAAMFSSVNERSLRHSRAQLVSLVDLSTDLERSRHIDDVLAALVRHGCGRLGFVRVAVLVGHDTGWTGIVDDGRVEALVELPEQPAPIVWECWSGAGPVLVRALDDPLLDAVLPDATNVMVASVAADGETLGVVVAEWGGDEDARIPTITVQSLEQAAMHTALGLRNAQLLLEVERLATRDSLTGIANRRLFDESLIRETARSQRLGAPLSLVVFDVDHFKQINDTYGHMTGDAVLCDVADAIVAGTKGFDVAARLGGDEFVLLLPGCRRDDAVGVADRVRAEITRRASQAAVTISAGVATMPDNAVDGERLVSAADAALYDAKRTGRDRAHASERVAEAGTPAPLRWAGAPLARGA